MSEILDAVRRAGVNVARRKKALKTEMDLLKELVRAAAAEGYSIRQIEAAMPSQAIRKSHIARIVRGLPPARRSSEGNKAASLKRKALIAAFPEIPRATLAELSDWYGGQCAYCSEPGGSGQFDHVIPLSRGGPHVIENLVACCSRCNSLKARQTPEEWGRLPKLHPFKSVP